MDKVLSVLVVEDDRLVQQSLRRVVASRRPNWNLLFASSAEDGERILSGKPSDVVVAGSRREDAGGEAFLGRVRELWPGSLRILMTEEGRDDDVATLLVSAHQLLGMPMSPDQFLNAVESAGRLGFLLMNERLREVVRRMEHLPVVPSVYRELNTEMRKENSSNSVIASIISRDMSLTTAILKIVNSPFFGLSRRVDDLMRAVNLLGANLIRGLVLSEGVFRPQDPDMYPGFDTERLWAHCLDMARCCQAVARGDGLGGREVEDAFLGGLLHDVGKIVLAEGCPEDYLGILLQSQDRNVPLFDVERERLGITHAQVGGYLLGLWGFPESVAEAIALHHGPSGSACSRLSAILHVVDATLHSRYVLKTGHGPHPIREDFLEAAGGEEVVHKWATTLAELDNAS